MVQLRDADRGRLAEQADATAAWHRTGSRVQAGRDMGVDQAQRVWSECSDTVRASEVDQRQAVRRLDLAAGEQNDAVGTLVCRLDHDVTELVASHEDEREVDLSVHRRYRCGRLGPGDLRAVGGDADQFPPAAR